jgi:hypothetical protein
VFFWRFVCVLAAKKIFDQKISSRKEAKIYIVYKKMLLDFPQQSYS